MDLKKTGLTVQNTEDLNYAFFPKSLTELGQELSKLLPCKDPAGSVIRPEHFSN